MTRIWLVFWLSGTVADAATTLIGQLQSSTYERNSLVNALGFKLTLVATLVLSLIVVAMVRLVVAHGTRYRGVLSVLLCGVGVTRWFAATVAVGSLTGILR